MDYTACQHVHLCYMNTLTEWEGRGEGRGERVGTGLGVNKFSEILCWESNDYMS